MRLQEGEKNAEKKILKDCTLSWTIKEENEKNYVWVKLKTPHELLKRSS